MLNIAKHENFSGNKYENADYCWHFLYLLAEKSSCSAELSMEKKFITSGPVRIWKYNQTCLNP